MKNFQHDNIVKLLGVCKKGEPVLTVMEFMLHGGWVSVGEGMLRVGGGVGEGMVRVRGGIGVGTVKVEESL